ncbi:hypothetical protein PCASD_10393 [Puccinia coronata f. sp. avenae]|uniref:Uncharacterized protein n=1 Tax=Puccinia coronata f. sp. avenae TaxID=200324 RepID=A0A2N5SIC1_9BASI|nr:hypothetical protein PCASD_20984 [Puccinia coronata f. sp. avenae]PLW40427.1 hypothetical protein PCASD_10393 [Puccinia coronata f. sp. avenae]
MAEVEAAPAQPIIYDYDSQPTLLKTQETHIYTPLGQPPAHSGKTRARLSLTLEPRK